MLSTKALQVGYSVEFHRLSTLGPTHCTTPIPRRYGILMHPDASWISWLITAASIVARCQNLAMSSSICSGRPRHHCVTPCHAMCAVHRSCIAPASTFIDLYTVYRYTDSYTVSIPALCHSRFIPIPDSSGTDRSLPSRSLLSGQRLLSGSGLGYHTGLSHLIGAPSQPSRGQVLTGNQCRLWTFHDCSPHTYTHTIHTLHTQSLGLFTGSVKHVKTLEHKWTQCSQVLLDQLHQHLRFVFDDVDLLDGFTPLKLFQSAWILTLPCRFADGFHLHVAENALCWLSICNATECHANNANNLLLPSTNIDLFAKVQLNLWSEIHWNSVASPGLKILWLVMFYHEMNKARLSPGLFCVPKS